MKDDFNKPLDKDEIMEEADNAFESGHEDLGMELLIALAEVTLGNYD